MLAPWHVMTMLVEHVAAGPPTSSVKTTEITLAGMAVDHRTGHLHTDDRSCLPHRSRAHPAGVKGTKLSMSQIFVGTIKLVGDTGCERSRPVLPVRTATPVVRAGAGVLLPFSETM